MRRLVLIGWIPALVLLQVACASADGHEKTAKPAAEEAPKVQLGNGEANRIVTEGLTREGRTLTFREVEIESPGWLVLHPFRDGKPQGKIYVGATYLEAGVSRDVVVSVQTAPEPTPGTMFIVMLHSDVNQDQTFDFVFVDERNVLDKAVFEGSTMIAHAIEAP